MCNTHTYTVFWILAETLFVCRPAQVALLQSVQNPTICKYMLPGAVSRTQLRVSPCNIATTTPTRKARMMIPVACNAVVHVFVNLQQMLLLLAWEHAKHTWLE